MALRKILTEEDPALRKRARQVEKFNGRLHTLLDDMANTMYDAGGCGLAAPQVGILQRAAVIDMSEERDQLIELINPEILSAEGEEEGAEGCLSVPGRQGLVARPGTVTVRAQDRFGAGFELTGAGMLARCLCHEIDHLHGRLYTDIMTRELSPEEIQSNEAQSDEAQKPAAKGPKEVR